MWLPGTLLRLRGNARYLLKGKERQDDWPGNVGINCIVIATKHVGFGTLGWRYEIAFLVEGKIVTKLLGQGVAVHFDVLTSPSSK